MGNGELPVWAPAGLPPLTHHPSRLHLWGRETEDWRRAQGPPTEGGFVWQQPCPEVGDGRDHLWGWWGAGDKPSQPLSSAGTCCSFSPNNCGLKCFLSENCPKSVTAVPWDGGDQNPHPLPQLQPCLAGSPNPLVITDHWITVVGRGKGQAGGQGGTSEPRVGTACGDHAPPLWVSFRHLFNGGHHHLPELSDGVRLGWGQGFCLWLETQSGQAQTSSCFWEEAAAVGEGPGLKLRRRGPRAD